MNSLSPAAQSIIDLIVQKGIVKVDSMPAWHRPERKKQQQRTGEYQPRQGRAHISEPNRSAGYEKMYSLTRFKTNKHERV